MLKAKAGAQGASSRRGKVVADQGLREAHAGPFHLKQDPQYDPMAVWVQ
jgi:hypothetical protein